MRALIALGGKGPGAFPMEASRYDRVVAADSGYDLLIGLGIMPDLVVGDLDSTQFRDSLIGKGIIPCSRDKDYTDAELAIRAAMPFDEYDIIGGRRGENGSSSFHFRSLWQVRRSPCLVHCRGCNDWYPQVCRLLPACR